MKKIVTDTLESGVLKRRQVQVVREGRWGGTLLFCVTCHYPNRYLWVEQEPNTPLRYLLAPEASRMLANVILDLLLNQDRA